jgi:hypothetical protein
MSDPRVSNRRGRPRLVAGEHTLPVCVRLNDSSYDRACQRASHDRVTVSTVIRRALARHLADDDDADD